MKNLLKLLVVLTISTPVVTNIVACGSKDEKRDQSLKLLNQEIVNHIIGFNSENNWNLIVTKDIKDPRAMIKTEIERKLPSNLQKTFKNGLFNIANFYNNKNEVLDSSYFLKRQSKTTLVFDFTFNTINDRATINLTVARNIEEQKIIDHIRLMQVLDLIMECHFDDGEAKLIDLIISSIAKTITEEPLKKYFFDNFKITNILYNNENLVADFFNKNSTKVKLQFKYSFGQDIIIDTVDFYLTITIDDKIEDTDVINKINKLTNLKIVMTATDNQGLVQVKERINEAISNALSLNCQNQNIKTRFEQGSFDIQSVEADGKVLDDSYFAKAHLDSKINISYTFGSINKKQNLILNLVVKETDQRVADVIKIAIPKEYSVKRRTNKADVEKDLFDTVKEYFATNKDVEDTIAMTFKEDAESKFKFGDFKRRDDKINVLNHQIYSLEVFYGLFSWKQDIEIIIL